MGVEYSRARQEGWPIRVSVRQKSRSRNESMSLRRVRNWCRLSPQERRLIDCRILLGRKGENSYDLTQPEMGSVAKATH